ncbi:MAG: hypothetical protein Q7S47_01585 [bacterium]|nr:hypothetical protein [bacterium]
MAVELKPKPVSPDDKGENLEGESPKADGERKIGFKERLSQSLDTVKGTAALFIGAIKATTERMSRREDAPVAALEIAESSLEKAITQAEADAETVLNAEHVSAAQSEDRMTLALDTLRADTNALLTELQKSIDISPQNQALLTQEDTVRARRHAVAVEYSGVSSQEEENISAASSHKTIPDLNVQLLKSESNKQDAQPKPASERDLRKQAKEELTEKKKEIPAAIEKAKEVVGGMRKMKNELSERILNLFGKYLNDSVSKIHKKVMGRLTDPIAEIEGVIYGLKRYHVPKNDNPRESIDGIRAMLQVDSQRISAKSDSFVRLYGHYEAEIARLEAQSKPDVEGVKQRGGEFATSLRSMLKDIPKEELEKLLSESEQAVFDYLKAAQKIDTPQSAVSAFGVFSEKMLELENKRDAIIASHAEQERRLEDYSVSRFDDESPAFIGRENAGKSVGVEHIAAIADAARSQGEPEAPSDVLSQSPDSDGQVDQGFVDSLQQGQRNKWSGLRRPRPVDVGSAISVDQSGVGSDGIAPYFRQIIEQGQNQGDSTRTEGKASVHRESAHAGAPEQIVASGDVAKNLEAGKFAIQHLSRAEDTFRDDPSIKGRELSQWENNYYDQFDDLKQSLHRTLTEAERILSEKGGSVEYMDQALESARRAMSVITAEGVVAPADVLSDALVLLSSHMYAIESTINAARQTFEHRRELEIELPLAEAEYLNVQKEIGSLHELDGIDLDATMAHARNLLMDARSSMTSHDVGKLDIGVTAARSCQRLFASLREKLKVVDPEEKEVTISSPLRERKIRVNEPTLGDAFNSPTEEQAAHGDDISRAQREVRVAGESAEKVEALQEQKVRVGYFVNRLNSDFGGAFNSDKVGLRSLGNDAEKWKQLADKLEPVFNAYITDDRPRYEKNGDHEAAVHAALSMSTEMPATGEVKMPVPIVSTRREVGRDQVITEPVKPNNGPETPPDTNDQGETNSEINAAQEELDWARKEFEVLLESVRQQNREAELALQISVAEDNISCLTKSIAERNLTKVGYSMEGDYTMRRAINNLRDALDNHAEPGIPNRGPETPLEQEYGRLRAQVESELESISELDNQQADLRGRYIALHENGMSDEVKASIHAAFEKANAVSVVNRVNVQALSAMERTRERRNSSEPVTETDITALNSALKAFDGFNYKNAKEACIKGFANAELLIRNAEQEGAQSASMEPAPHRTFVDIEKGQNIPVSELSGVKTPEKKGFAWAVEERTVEGQKQELNALQQRVNKLYENFEKNRRILSVLESNLAQLKNEQQYEAGQYKDKPKALASFTDGFQREIDAFRAKLEAIEQGKPISGMSEGAKNETGRATSEKKQKTEGGTAESKTTTVAEALTSQEKIEKRSKAEAAWQEAQFALDTFLYGEDKDESRFNNKEFALVKNIIVKGETVQSLLNEMESALGECNTLLAGKTAKDLDRAYELVASIPKRLNEIEEVIATEDTSEAGKVYNETLSLHSAMEALLGKIVKGLDEAGNLGQYLDKLGDLQDELSDVYERLHSGEIGVHTKAIAEQLGEKLSDFAREVEKHMPLSEDAKKEIQSRLNTIKSQLLDKKSDWNKVEKDPLWDRYARGGGRIDVHLEEKGAPGYRGFTGEMARYQTLRAEWDSLERQIADGEDQLKTYESSDARRQLQQSLDLLKSKANKIQAKIEGAANGLVEHNHKALAILNGVEGVSKKKTKDDILHDLWKKDVVELSTEIKDHKGILSVLTEKLEGVVKKLEELQMLEDDIRPAYEKYDKDEKELVGEKNKLAAEITAIRRDKSLKTYEKTENISKAQKLLDSAASKLAIVQERLPELRGLISVISKQKKVFEGNRAHWQTRVDTYSELTKRFSVEGVTIPIRYKIDANTKIAGVDSDTSRSNGLADMGDQVIRRESSEDSENDDEDDGDEGVDDGVDDGTGSIVQTDRSRRPDTKKRDVLRVNGMDYVNRLNQGLGARGAWRNSVNEELFFRQNPSLSGETDWKKLKEALIAFRKDLPPAALDQEAKLAA